MKYVIHTGLLIAGILCTHPGADAQGYIHFNHLNIADGLSNNQVEGICQGKYGFLWFATNEGLNRYDGKNFVIYRHIPGDSTSISSNYLFHLVTGKKGNIWVSSNVGISCLHPFSGKFENFFVYRNGNKIYHAFKYLGITASGEVLVMVNSRNQSGPLLFHADKNTHRLIPVPVPALARGHPWSWYYDIRLLPNGDIIYLDSIFLYRSTDGGKHYSLLNKEKEVPQGLTYAPLHLCAVDNNACWVKNKKNQFWCYFYKEHIWKEFGGPENPSPDIQTSCNYNGEYWLSGYISGLLRFDEEGQHYTLFTHDNTDPSSISDNTINASYVDEGGTLWLGTMAGIDYWNAGTSNIHYLNNRMQGFAEFGGPAWGSMAEDSTGMLWLGSLDYSNFPNCLFSLNPETLQHKRYVFDVINKEGIPIWDILPLNTTQILLSTQGGLFNFNEQTGRLSHTFPYHFPPLITHFNTGMPILLKDNQNNFWFGLWRRGLVRYNPRTYQTIYFSDSASNPLQRLPENNIGAACEDVQHHIWLIYGHDNLLTCIDPAAAIILKNYRLRYKGQPFEGNLSCIWSDPSGKVWIGTGSAWLIRFDPVHQKLKLITTADGLISEMIYALCGDDKGRLWLYTARGIQCLNILSGTFYNPYINITPPSGSIEASPMLYTRNKTMFVGYGKNLLYFKPDKILRPYSIMPPVILSIAKSGKTKLVSPATYLINIHHKDDFFSISFITLDMLHNHLLQYSYRLKGYSGQWVSTGQEGNATFSRLPPDHYELQMRATVAGMPWNGKYSILKINVIPAFYQTWIFKIIILSILVASLIYLIWYLSTRRYRIQVAQMKRQQQITNIRNRIAQDIHDDIGAGLTRISIQSELLKHNPDSEKTDYLKMMENISKQAKELTRSLGEIVWTIHPGHDNIEEMLAFFRVYIHHFIEGCSLTAEIHFPEKEDHRNIHPDIKRNLLLILKESLNNVVKYAHAEKITITFFTRGEKEYTFSIQDNGTGFKEEDITFGNGLHNMHKRAEMIHATVEEWSRPGEGTRIVVRGEFY